MEVAQEPAPPRVQEERALAAQRFGQERQAIAAVGQGRGVELHELEVGQARARPTREENALPQRGRRVGGRRIEAADAARGQDDGSRCVDVVRGAHAHHAAAIPAQLGGSAVEHHLDVGRARVVLVEMQDALLAPFSPASQRHALGSLTERGVEVRLGAQVARVRADRVTLADGEELAAHTLVWAAGVQANPTGRALGLATGRAGRIVVGPDLQVPDHPGVWAIGDVAAIEPVAGRGELLPQLAPVAIQSGRFVAGQIAAATAGRPAAERRFRYRDKGTMATIGRSRAVAELPLGIHLQGFPAWLSWLGLHLVMLAGFRNRISVFANWAWNWLTYDRGPRLIFRPGRRTER